MQPWRIYPLCSIVYTSEPHNCFSQILITHWSHIWNVGYDDEFQCSLVNMSKDEILRHLAGPGQSCEKMKNLI
ncbi:hypothetical protein Hanom_Chr11g01006831 [Helianthus anomalus]